MLLRHSACLALTLLCGAHARAAYDDDGVSYASPAGPNDNGIATSMALLPDGRFYASGFTLVRGSTDNYTVRILRFNADGSVDPSFSVALQHTGSVSAGRQTLLAQPDGAVIAAYTLANPASPSDSYTQVRRFLPDGSADPGFSTFSFDPSLGADSLDALALQADGRILAAGSRPLSDGSGGRAGVLLRLNADGSEDTGFSDDGYLSLTNLPSPNFHALVHNDIKLSCIALLPDGRIFTAGGAAAGFTYGEMVLMRYLPDGRPDPEFNGGSPKLHAQRSGNQVGFFSSAGACDVAPDGTSILAGTSTASGARRAWLLQFDPQGALVTSRIDDTGSGGTLHAVQLLPNGGVVASGTFYDGQEYGLLAVYEHGLAFSGQFYGRFLNADRGHALYAASFDPNSGALVSVGSGITLQNGLYSNRWLAAVDPIALDLDLTPDPVSIPLRDGVAPGSRVEDTRLVTGFSSATRLPLRLRNGVATAQGGSVSDDGIAPDTLAFLADGGDPASLALTLSHDAAPLVGAENHTRIEIGGLVRSNNLALTLGAPVSATLTSLTGLTSALFGDGFEDAP